MNPPEFPSGETSTPSPKRELQLQGPRPPPLRVSKESIKIRKPPLHPTAAHNAQAPPLHPAANNNAQAPPDQRQPLIIYSVSPKVLHVTVSDFMNVVQRLTGPSSSSAGSEEPPLRSGEVSPAARLASIEKTSPSEKDRVVHSVDDDMAWLLEGVDMTQFPGILSPAPATLPPISSGLFSPAMEPQTTSFMHELSPFWSPNSFVTSPSGFLSAAVLSPLPSPDLFNIFD